ncbi:hypothetical protein HID58_076345 [Brassica napus]|uniref:Uncharacterized protein n=1 Tax=Brassica napus TaxID=3708 RepID=A0ABQ7YPV3_BRANA|nr:hypothetical protein HID58_076345 [Brassica napus]
MVRSCAREAVRGAGSLGGQAMRPSRVMFALPFRVWYELHSVPLPASCGVSSDVKTVKTRGSWFCFNTLGLD